jgi:hypothetical protein
VIALALHPSQQGLLRLLAGCVEISAILSPGRSRWHRPPAPVFSRLDELLAAQTPRACCFLWPYAGLKKDLASCLEHQLPALSAGPVDLPPSPLWQWGGQHHHSPLFRAALAQRQSPAFGAPVYLRRVVGGGGTRLSAWWAACQLLAEARELLGAELAELQLAACREGRRHHLALSAAFAGRATAHLVVAPAYFAPGGDLTLLGSGGLVFADSAPNTPLLVSDGGAQLHPPAFLHPEPAWVAEFVGRLDRPAPAGEAQLELQVLRALRQALRQQQLVPVVFGCRT